MDNNPSLPPLLNDDERRSLAAVSNVKDLHALVALIADRTRSPAPGVIYARSREFEENEEIRVIADGAGGAILQHVELVGVEVCQLNSRAFSNPSYAIHLLDLLDKEDWRDGGQVPSDADLAVINQLRESPLALFDPDLIPEHVGHLMRPGCSHNGVRVGAINYEGTTVLLATRDGIWEAVRIPADATS